MVVVRRAMRATRRSQRGWPGRPWGRILRAPFFPGWPGVVRVRGLATATGRAARWTCTTAAIGRSAPVLLHFHGGGFYSGNKAREARPLIRTHQPARFRLCERGLPAAAARDPRRPGGRRARRDRLVRAHAAEYGAEPGTLFLAGSSARANLAIRAVCEGETGIAGLICRYGYYGNLAPRGDMPPMLVVHGEKDMFIPPSDVRAFVERVRAVSSRPVTYAELPGAHHDFDLFESIRSAAVNKAVEQFTARVG